jgi:ABC-type microcin C transport system duplicated ATPase subunit YejF
MGYLFVSNDLNVVRLLCDRSVIAVSLRGAAGDEAISTDRVLSGPRLFRCANKNKMVQGAIW